MAKEKNVYKNPQPGTPLISTISSGCRTPLLQIKFSNIVKPFYYPNSPTIPRYSVTCVADPNTHEQFIVGIQTIEKNEGVESVIKNESAKLDGKSVMTGNLLIKFQSKNQIPVYRVDDRTTQNGEPKPVLMTLEDELAKGTNVIIVYEILRYTKKNTMKTEHGISFKPTEIFYYPTVNEINEENE